MSMPKTITDAMLQGFVDGRLVEEERAAVAAYLDANPEAAAEVAHLQRQRDALRTLYAPVMAEPVPTRLDPRRLMARQRARTWAVARYAAAAVVLVGIGVAAGWFAHDRMAPDPASLLIADAINAHSLYVRESRHAVEVAASEEKHLSTWLSNRLSRQISPPNLSGQGFSLVGGRLLPASIGVKSGPAAQLMYENGTADRLTVYVTAALPGGDEDSYSEELNGLDVFYWSNDSITCTVVADLPKDQMQGMARTVFQQLSWR